MEKKFRAWIPKHEYDASDKPEYKMTYDLAFEDYAPINDLLNDMEYVMQYVWKKDCNGVELYEGDIIRGNRSKFCLPETGFNEVLSQDSVLIHGYEYRIVGFEVRNDGVFFFLPTEISYAEQSNPISWELVGNIYQNPELIERCVNK